MFVKQGLFLSIIILQGILDILLKYVSILALKGIIPSVSLLHWLHNLPYFSMFTTSLLWLLCK